MAASVPNILSSLGLSSDSTLEQILSKLIDYNLMTTDEIHNIQNISVKPLPNIVRNQADILKQRMYGIATDEDYGLPIVINRRMVLIRYILDKLNIKLDTLIDELENGDFIVNKATNDENGSNIKDTYETKADATTKNSTLNTKVDTLKSELENGSIIVKKAYNDSANNNIAQTYETKSDATTKNNAITRNVSTLKTDLGNGGFVVKKAETDGANNVIHTTYETKLDANAKLNSSKSYTDIKLDELKRTLLGDNYDELYDTFKEISDYIASDKTFAQEILNKIETNQRNIATNTNNIENNSLRINNLDSRVSLKANTSDVYPKTEVFTKTEIEKMLEDISSIGFVANDSPTIKESIKTVDESILDGKWIFTNEEYIQLFTGGYTTDFSFSDSFGNKFEEISFSTTGSSYLENGITYAKFSVSGITENGETKELFNPVNKTGLAYNENGVLKNSYYLIIPNTYLDISSYIGRFLTAICSKVEFKTSVSADEFVYNGEKVTTIKDLYKTEIDNSTLIGTWKFKTSELNYSNSKFDYDINVKDSLGNEFVRLASNGATSIGNLKYAPLLYGYLNNGSKKLLYDTNLEGFSTGLAFNEDGTFNEDYYLIFEEENADVLNTIQKLANKYDIFTTVENVNDIVDKKVAKLVNSAPETLDTLGELAQVLKENNTVVEALNSSITNKVDKVEGKQLSTNDYTNEEKTKLSNLENYDDTNLLARIVALEQSGGSGGSSLANQVFAVDEEGNRYEVYGVDKDGNKYLVTYTEVE